MPTSMAAPSSPTVVTNEPDEGRTTPAPSWLRPKTDSFVIRRSPGTARPTARAIQMAVRRVQARPQRHRHRTPRPPSTGPCSASSRRSSDRATQTSRRRPTAEAQQFFENPGAASPLNHLGVERRLADVVEAADRFAGGLQHTMTRPTTAATPCRTRSGSDAPTFLSAPGSSTPPADDPAQGEAARSSA